MSGHRWAPGETGNPAGAPPKSRALTACLAAAFDTMRDADGELITGRALVARLIADGLCMGHIEFPDGGKLRLATKEWIDLAKFLYGQVDGPPRAELDISVKAHAQKIAEQYGLDVADVLKEAQSILSEPSVPMQGT